MRPLRFERFAPFVAPAASSAGDHVAARNFPLERVGDVLAVSIKRLDLGTRLDEYGVWPIWTEIVGEPVARNAQPEKIRNGTLFVKCSSPVWMQQLHFMKEMIAENLNQRLRREIVKNIFFVVGKLDDAAVGEPKAAAVPKPFALAETMPDPSFIESIDDPEIRAAFADLLKSFNRRKQKR